MRASKILHIVSCHAGGEVGDVIVAGAPPVPGATIWEQSRFIASDQTLRRFVLNEPRGGVFRHVNLLVPPKSPDAQFGWIIMEPEDTPPMSGSNAMCVATVLLETGIVPIQEPETRITLEAPGGLVEIRATCSAEKADRITVVNVPSFADSLDANLEVDGVGTLSVDTAYGGDSFVLVEARRLGFSLSPDEASDLTRMGARIVAAANRQLAFDPLRRTPLSKISFCQFTLPVERAAAHVAGLSAVVIRPGKVDRSPCGTGCSARMSVLHARGQLRPGEVFIGRSILGSEFACKIEREVTLGGRPAIIPSISGNAWITGLHQYMLDPTDPWPEGYRLSDTWPTSPPSHELIGERLHGMQDQVGRSEIQVPGLSSAWGG